MMKNIKWFSILLIVCLLFSCNKKSESEKPIEVTFLRIPNETVSSDESGVSDESWEDRLERMSAFYKNTQYGSDFSSIDFSSIVLPEKDYSNIRFGNCEIITQYSIPDIINVHTGATDGELPASLVSVSYLYRTWSGFLVILKKDIDTNKEITLIAKGGTNEYVYQNKIKPEKINNYRDPDNYFGYYFDVTFENKPWLNNSDNRNNWRFIVKSGSEELINEELYFDFTYILFDKLDDSPFVVNNLQAVNQNREYTYRFRTQDADFLALYIYHEIREPYYGSIYRPIVYLKPISNSGEYTDIKISWNNRELAGIYHIGRHRINRLPVSELMIPVFESFVVR